LIEQDQVDLIVGGGAASGCALAMQGIVTPRKMLFVSPEADPRISDPPTANPTTIQTTLRSTTVVQKLLEYAKSKGKTKIAVLGSTDAYGQSGIAAAQDLASKVGVRIVKTGSMSTSASDVTPQLRDLSGADPTAYILWTSLPVGVTAIKNAHDLGLDKNALIMMSHSFANTTFMKQAGDAGKGVYVPVVNATVVKQVLKVMPPADSKRLKAFSNLYTKAYSQDIAIFSAQCYDAMNVAIRALRLTKGNTDGPTLVKALEKAGTYNGVIGPHKFTSTDHYGLGSDNLRMSRWSGAGWILQK
jgi:branched-chain amino acid transport system substrate-binding protein